MYDLTRNRKAVSLESENEVMSRVWNEYFFNLPDMEPELEEKILYISRHPDFRYHFAKTDGGAAQPGAECGHEDGRKIQRGKSMTKYCYVG